MKKYLLIPIVAATATAVAQTTVVTPAADTATTAVETTSSTVETTTATAANAATTTTTVATGTVTEFNPGTTMIVKEQSGPVTYSYGDTVTYVSPAGEEIAVEKAKSMIQVGAPVSVSYATRGDTRVIERVELGELENAEIEVEDGKVEVESD